MQICLLKVVTFIDLSAPCSQLTAWKFQRTEQNILGPDITETIVTAPLNKPTFDQATAQKFGLPMGYVGKEMDEIDASADQKFSMFEAAIAADLAYYQRSSEDREGKCRSRVSSISDDSVLSGDRQEQLNLWIPGHTA